MNYISTLPEFRDYIKYALGEPVLCVEISNEQLDWIITDTIQLFQRYMYGEGLYEDYILLNVSPKVSAYALSGVEDVVDLQLSNAGGINTLFSNTHQLLYNDWVVQGNYPGGPGNIPGMGGGNILSDYQGTMQYLEEIKNTFGRRYTAYYRGNRNELVILPTPETSGVCMMRVYKKDAAENLYNNILIKRMAVAKAKKQWGLHLKKYSLTLPGGGTLNGDSIYQDGVTEETELMESFRKESEPIDFYVA